MDGVSLGLLLYSELFENRVICATLAMAGLEFSDPDTLFEEPSETGEYHIFDILDEEGEDSEYDFSLDVYKLSNEAGESVMLRLLSVLKLEETEYRLLSLKEPSGQKALVALRQRGSRCTLVREESIQAALLSQYRTILKTSLEKQEYCFLHG